MTSAWSPWGHAPLAERDVVGLGSVVVGHPFQSPSPRFVDRVSSADPKLIEGPMSCVTEGGSKQGKCVMSEAAAEAFRYLNAGTWLHYRGQGDTPTAARDRAARAAGVSRAQAERVWKRWKQMKSVNGDVYRRLRNQYEHLCSVVESAADAVEAKRRAIEEAHEADTSSAPIGAGTDSAGARAAREAAQ